MLTKTYPFTEAEGAAIAEQVRVASGDMIAIDPTQPTGGALTHGVQLAWSIAGDAVTVKVLHQPWYVSDEQIGNALDKMFAEVQG